MNPSRLAGLHSVVTHDSSFGIFQEADDVLDLRTIGHLILDLVDHIIDARFSMEKQTISVCNVFLHFLVDASILHHRNVRTTVLHGVSTCDDIRRHIM